MRKNMLFILFTLSLLHAQADDVTAIASPAEIGLNNGSITLTITGGIAPYSFSWTGPDGYISAEQNITDLAPGEYCVVVTDNFCGATTVCVTVEESQLNYVNNFALLTCDVSPNPFDALLFIDILVNESATYHFTLVDINGKLVYSNFRYLSSGNHLEEMNNLPELAAGQYQLQISRAKQVVFQTSVVKQ